MIMEYQSQDWKREYVNNTRIYQQDERQFCKIAWFFCYGLDRELDYIRKKEISSVYDLYTAYRNGMLDGMRQVFQANTSQTVR